MTGATGFVGRHVCRALLAAGHSVVGLARSEPPAGSPGYVEGVTYRRGDVRDPADRLVGSMEGCQAVVHLVGIIAEVRTQGQTFEAVHVAGTRHVVEAAQKAGAARERFVYVSAVGADLEARSEYSRTKAVAERAVEESGLPYTILRPSIVLGPDADFLEQIEGLIRKPPGSPFPLPFVPVPGRGTNLFQPVYIDDLARCVVAAVSSGEETRGLFEIGGADQVSFNALIESVQRHLGVTKRLLHVPVPLLWAAAAVLEAVLPRPPVTTDQLINLGRDNVCDNGPVRAAFGVDPLPFENALARSYAARRGSVGAVS